MSFFRGYFRGLAAASIIVAALPATAAAQPDLIQRGAYLVRAAGCVTCHTDSKGGGQSFAGGHGLKTPFGIYYSPNITPDKETGIGTWSDEDFLAAIKRGQRSDGSHYFPVFPYTTYTLMRDEDALAIKAYLFSLSPVSAENKEHDVDMPFNWRWTMLFWKWMYFDERDFVPDDSQDDVWNRGAYLVEALAHCGECHTPRNFAGALVREMWMAGTEDGPEGDAAPNLTTDKDTGLGWTDEQLTFFLKTGTKPGWDEAEGVMADAINDGYRHLTEEDREAITKYINSLPPIVNHIGG